MSWMRWMRSLPLRVTRESAASTSGSSVSTTRMRKPPIIQNGGCRSLGTVTRRVYSGTPGGSCSKGCSLISYPMLHSSRVHASLFTRHEPLLNHVLHGLHVHRAEAPKQLRRLLVVESGVL